MRTRNTLTAAEVMKMLEHLEERLARIGLETQPDVALKILNLTTDPKSQLSDYARVIKTDPGLSGRLLKLSNSALFAQRNPVTSIDRACLLIGVSRLKSMSLGFHLGRAVAGAGAKELTRRVWGESVLRGCLAAELAKLAAPMHTSEAFVVGLMMDSGVPLMARLLDCDYVGLYKQAGGAGRLWKMEFESLPFTHVDLIRALATRWRLPDLLARPLEWHHTRPADTRRDEPMHRLHRIAYVVGNIQFADAAPVLDTPERVAAAQSAAGKAGAEVVFAAPALSANSPGVSLAARVLGISEAESRHAAESASREYTATIEVFSGFAEKLGQTEELVERLHSGLVTALDDVLEEVLRTEDTAQQYRRLVIGGAAVQVVAEKDRQAVAYLYDSRGHKLLSHRFALGAASAAQVCEALGIEPQSPDETHHLEECLRKLAA